MEPCAHTGVKTVHAEGTCRCQVGACLVCGEEQGGRCGWSGVSGGGGEETGNGAREVTRPNGIGPVGNCKSF